MDYVEFYPEKPQNEAPNQRGPKGAPGERPARKYSDQKEQL